MTKSQESVQDQIAFIRAASRELVRELGVLGGGNRSGSEPGPLQCHVLIEIASGTVNPADLAEKLLLDRPSMSRVIRQLLDARLVRRAEDRTDRRRRPLVLTDAGRRSLRRVNADADTQVGGALSTLGEERINQIVEGLSLYARALRRARLRSEFVIRPIRRKDEPGMAAVIRNVMPEFGASGPGFAINDPEVDHMYSAYSPERHAYFVLVRGGTITGGGGVAPLEGGPADVCELRKMYFLPEARGLGFGQEILDRALAEAKQAGFRRCYLETLTGMTDAQRLYRANGFEKIESAMGATGHFGCNSFYIRDL